MASKLTTIAEEAAQSRSLNGAFHGRTLLKLCAELEGLDLAVEKRKKLANRTKIGGIVAVVVSVLALVFLCGFAGLTDLLIPLFCLLAISLATAFLGTRLQKAAGKVDLSDELRLTVQPMLRKVIADLDPKQKIRVRWNLCPIDAEKADKSVPVISGGGRRGSTDINLFSEPLGSLQLSLANGNTIVLRLRNQYRQSVRSYRSSSGKSKRKEKWKKISKVTAILIPNSPTAAWVERTMKGFVNPAKESLRFKDREGITTARLDRRFKYQKAGEQPADVVPAAEVLSMLVRLSAMAHQGIQGAKSAK